MIGLVAATGQSAGDSLLPLLDDPDPGVQAAAAKGLVELGRREGLRSLVALLDAQDIRHRTLAYRTLRAATGAEITYVVYDPPDRRAPAIAAWKKWLAEEAEQSPFVPRSRRCRSILAESSFVIPAALG